jgi:hypothetical protein
VGSRALLVLAALLSTDDAWRVPALESDLDHRIAALRESSAPLVPRALEAAIDADLDLLVRLDPDSATARARSLLAAVRPESALGWAARRTLAASGDLETVRLALARYFEAPVRWGEVLAASDDPRLSDFDDGNQAGPLSETFFLTTLERNLSRAREREAIRALLAWARSARDPSSPRRVLEVVPPGVPLEASVRDWLARNPKPAEPAVDRAGEPEEAVDRGFTLASLLLSSDTDELEKREALLAMRDAWAEAVARGGPDVFEILERFLSPEEIARAFFDAEPVEPILDALAVIPSSSARLRLEALGTPEAIERIMRREDRFLSVPALSRMRREGSRPAGLALLSLGAPGASAWLRSELATGSDRESLLAAAVVSPGEAELAKALARKAASSPAPSPVGFAALFRLPLGALVAETSGPLAERVHRAMSIGGEGRHLPILIDLAVGSAASASSASRDAAFQGLAEADLGPFAPRLHRLAGDPDREVRVRAAAALVPEGEVWTLRLLLADADASSSRERAIARRAVRRLSSDRARELLFDVVSDGTAGSLGCLLYLELAEAEVRKNRALQLKLWRILADDARAGRAPALLAASRMSHAEAVAAVTQKLSRR